MLVCDGFESRSSSRCEKLLGGLIISMEEEEEEELRECVRTGGVMKEPSISLDAESELKRDSILDSLISGAGAWISMRKRI